MQKPSGPVEAGQAHIDWEGAYWGAVSKIQELTEHVGRLESLVSRMRHDRGESSKRIRELERLLEDCRRDELEKLL